VILRTYIEYLVLYLRNRKKDGGERERGDGGVYILFTLFTPLCTSPPISLDMVSSNSPRLHHLIIIIP